MTRSKVPNSTKVGVGKRRIWVSRSASRSGPRTRATKARVFAWIAGSETGRGADRSGGLAPLRLLPRQPQRDLGAERGPHQIEFVDAELADRSDHRLSQFGHRPRSSVLGRRAEARHFKGDHPVMPAEQIMPWREATAAGTMEMHERQALPRFHIADTEPVRLDKTFAERRSGCLTFQSILGLHHNRTLLAHKSRIRGRTFV